MADSETDIVLIGLVCVTNMEDASEHFEEVLKHVKKEQCEEHTRTVQMGVLSTMPRFLVAEVAPVVLCLDFSSQLENI
ncbi:hypothetical protein SLA2020_015990 [Shorea laevis]